MNFSLSFVLLTVFWIYSGVQPTTVQPYTVQPAAVQSNTVQPNTVQPAAVQPNTVQRAAVQPNTVQRAAVTLEKDEDPTDATKLEIDQAKRACKMLEDYEEEPPLNFVRADLLRYYCPRRLRKYFSSPRVTDYFLYEYYKHCVINETMVGHQGFCNAIFAQRERIKEFQMKDSWKNSTMVKVAYFDLSCGRASNITNSLGIDLGIKVVYHTEIEINGCRTYFSEKGLISYCDKVPKVSLNSSL